MKASVMESAQTLQPWSFAWRITTPSGTQKWLEASGRPTCQSNGVILWDTLILDVTALKLAEEKSREQQAQLDLVVQASNIGFYISDLVTNTSFVSPAYKAQLGYPADAAEACPADWKSRLHPDDFARATAAYRAFENKEAPYNMDFRLRHRDGSYRWIYSDAQLICDRSGTPVKVVGIHLDITERKQAEAALQVSEQRFRTLFESTPKIAVQGYNRHREVIYWNDASEQLYGYTKAEALGRQMENLIVPPELQQDVISEVQYWLETGKSPPAREVSLMRKDGSSIPVYSSHIMQVNLQDELEMYCVDIDLSDLKMAELALRESESRYRLLAENANDLVCLHDLSSRYLYVSPSCEMLLGYQYEEMLGKEHFSFIHPDDLERVSQKVHLTLGAGKPTPITYRMRQRSGNYIWFETLTQPIFDTDGKIFQLRTTSRDVTERIQAQDRLKYDALHDALTGLPNRHLLMERLELVINQSKRLNNYHFAILFIDLDRFKIINDSLGHIAGDRLLISISQSLKTCLSETDLAARLGGDEFVILLENLANIREAIHITKKIMEKLQTPILLEGREVYITSSIGVVFGTDDYSHASHLLRDADIAMYRAKEKGRAQFEIFDVEMHKQALNRLHLENDLRRAIEENEFVLHYQPIVELSTRNIVGFEALIRWECPNRGLKLPGKFIPVAEETGLITTLDTWTLQAACCQLAAWQKEFPELSQINLSVNLSAQDLLESKLLKKIDDALDRNDLHGSFLTLEITESMLIGDINSTIYLLNKLRSRGIKISIDDFGTGYSSLSYLHRLPIDSLKVDRSFINQIQVGYSNHQIAETIVTLSNQLKLNTIAEGIETQHQLELLQNLGYKFGQGYLFSKPVDHQEATKFLIGKWLPRTKMMATESQTRHHI